MLPCGFVKQAKPGNAGQKAGENRQNRMKGDG
jgi:hypothetical protein